MTDAVAQARIAAEHGHRRALAYPLRSCVVAGIWCSVATTVFIVGATSLVSGSGFEHSVDRMVEVWWVFVGPLLAGIASGLIWTAVRATRRLQETSPAFLLGLRAIQFVCVAAVVCWYATERL